MSRILYIGDSPLVGTGYGRLAGAILPALARAGHNVDAIGLSASPATPKTMRVDGIELLSVPVTASGWREAFAHLVGAADVVFAIGDPHAVPPRDAIGDARAVMYTGTDWPCSRDVGAELERYDVVVAANRYGRRCIEASSRPKRLEVIAHGMDLATFKPAASSPARARLGLGVEDVLVVNVATNTRRKNLPALIDAFAQFRGELAREGRRAVLYLHVQPVAAIAPEITINLPAVAHACGLVAGRDVLFPSSPVPHGPGSSSADIAEVLQAADAFISSSLSEGWCLPMSEAMACGTPVIVPGHSAFADVAELATVYSVTGRDWIPELGAHRPHVSAAAIYSGLRGWWRARLAGELAPVIAKAREWTDALDWSRVLPEWISLFRRLAP